MQPPRQKAGPLEIPESLFEEGFHPDYVCGLSNYGVVWRAIEKKVGLVTAIHRVTNAFEHAESARRNYRLVQMLFMRNAHPNVVLYRGIHLPYNGALKDDDLYLYSEYCHGNLQKVLKAHRLANYEIDILTDNERCLFTFQILQGLKNLHRDRVAGIGLLPRNILVILPERKSKFVCIKLHDLRLAKYFRKHEDKEFQSTVAEDIMHSGVVISTLWDFQQIEANDKSQNEKIEQEPDIPKGMELTYGVASLMTRMMDDDPLKRPTAEQVLQDPVFANLKAGLKEKYPMYHEALEIGDDLDEITFSDETWDDSIFRSRDWYLLEVKKMRDKVSLSAGAIEMENLEKQRGKNAYVQGGGPRLQLRRVFGRNLSVRRLRRCGSSWMGLAMAYFCLSSQSSR